MAAGAGADSGGSGATAGNTAARVSSSTAIPPEDIQEEDDSRRAEAGLSEAWEKYRQFEAFR